MHQRLDRWREPPWPDVPAGIAAVHAEIAQDAAKKLRLQDFERNQTVIGRVVRLQSQSDPSNLFDDGGDREISIYWDSFNLRRYQRPCGASRSTISCCE
jgi:hypothetical protein